MFDDYEIDRETEQGYDAANKDHPRTSFTSLKKYTRKLNVMSTDVTKRREVKAWMKDPYRRAPNKAQYWTQRTDWGLKQEDAALAWLSIHSPELPPELETEDGKQVQGSGRPVETGGNTAYALWEEVNSQCLPEDDKSAETWEVRDPDGGIDYSSLGRGRDRYREHGNAFVGGLSCYVWDDVLVDQIAEDDPEYRALVRSQGLTCEARQVMRQVRADRVQRHLEAQAKRLRWRGMEEYDACAKADEDMAKGLHRVKRESNAKPLPDIGRLHELYRVVNGQLIRTAAVRGGKVGEVLTSKHTRVDGEKHTTSRIIYAIETGEDAGSKMVRGSTASYYRNAEGSTRETDYGWEALINVGDQKRRTIGVYVSDEQAKAACKIYLKSLEMGNWHPKRV